MIQSSDLSHDQKVALNLIARAEDQFKNTREIVIFLQDLIDFFQVEADFTTKYM